MDKYLDDILKLFDLETSEARSIDNVWHFKRFKGLWHFKDSRNSRDFRSWAYFHFENEIHEIILSPLTLKHPGVVLRSEHTCETISKQVKLADDYDEIEKEQK